MALTKVRLPVADIAAISNGNSDVDIATSGADVIVTANGVTSGTFGDTAVTLALPLSVNNIDDVENIDMTVSGGATGVVEAISTLLRLWTTSAHPVVLGANSTTALTIGTDGKVALGVEGTGASHLVTKNYVDSTSGIGSADISANLATTGSVSIPTSTGNDLIINWGVTGSLNNSSTNVTFDTPFPNSFLVGFVTKNNSVGGTTNDKEAYIGGNPSTTGMTVSNPQEESQQIYWMAIGF